EAEMGVVALRLLPAGPAGHQHEDELRLAARLGEPDDALARRAAGTLVHGNETAEPAVEGDAGVEIAHMQRDMGEGGGKGRLHAGEPRPRSPRIASGPAPSGSGPFGSALVHHAA